MFSFQPNGHLVYGTPTTSQGYQIHDDLIADHHQDIMESNLISFATSGNDGSKHVDITSFEPSSLLKESKNECSTFRKVMHREVERKRRQEMSELCSSLGSLLPLGQIKGKRSICDQIEEAEKHIKKTEKRIEELRIRREKLKKKSIYFSGPKLSSSNGGDECVTVNLVSNGMEILLSSSSDLGLSRLLAVLVERELDVASCVSTRTKNERFVHIIKIEAPYTMNLDASELQDRLSDAIK